MKKSLRLGFLLVLTTLFGRPAAAQWLVQSTNLADNSGIRDIAAVSSTVAWAVGYDGTDPDAAFTRAIRTTDGGTTWTPSLVNGSSGLTFAGICALDDQTAWVAMNNNANNGGAIFRTTNGGTSWTRQAATAFPAAAGGFINGIHMLSTTRGVAIGDPTNGYFEIYTTTDAGVTWTRVPSGSIPAPLSATEFGVTGTVFGQGANVWFGTSEGRVLRSTNGGLTWQVSVTGLSAVNNMAFTDATHGLASTADVPTAVSRTTDGGATWTAVTTSGPVYASDIGNVPGTVGAYVSVGTATSAQGSSYSLDYGTTWTVIDANVPHMSVGFVSAQAGWVGGFTGAFRTGGIYAGSIPTTPLPAAPNWVWGRRFGSTGLDNGNHIVADNSGNTYATGYFTNSITFGATTLTGPGTDAYVVKLNASGTVQWARQIGGSGDDEGDHVALAPNGDVFATGTYEGTISFGGTSTTLTSLGGTDVYVACYSPTGVLRWAHNLGGTADDGVPVLAVSNSHLFVAGTFESPILSIAGGPFFQMGNGDVFIASLSTATGAEEWGYSDGGTAVEIVQSMAAAPNGDVLVCGNFNGLTQLAGFTYGSPNADPFLLRVDALGSPIWAEHGDGPGSADYASDVAVDAAGNAYLTATFYSHTLSFGPFTLNMPLTGSSTNDMYVVKYDPSGTVLWARNAGSTVSCFGNEIVVSNTGNVYIAGNWGGTVTFGGNTLVQPAAGNLPFVAMYNSAGRPQWGRASTGGTPTSGSLGLALDASANAYMIGRFNTSLTFGSDVLSSAGLTDIFIAKLGTTCTLAVPTVSAPDVCAGRPLVLTATGVPSGTTLQWVGPNNFSSTQASPTIPNATTAASGTYTLTVTSAALGCSVAASVSVTVDAAPAAPTSVGARRCGPGSTSLSAAGTPTGGTYRWYTTATGGTPIAGVSGSVYATPSLTATTIYYVSAVSAGGCESPRTAVTATIAAFPTALITASGPTTVCQGSSVTLTASAGASYQWSNGLSTPSITVSTGGNYFVTVTNALGCAATSPAVAVTVTPQASAAFVYASATYCRSAGGTATPTITGTSGGRFSALPAGLAINPTTGALNLTTSQPGTYTVTYSVGGTCPASATTSLTVTTAPVAAFSYPVASACGGTVATLLPTLGAGASAGAFTVTPAGLTLNANTGTINLATSQPGIYTVTNTLAAAGPCPGVVATTLFTVLATPVTPAITQTGSGPVTLTSSTPTGNQWFYNGQPIPGATGRTYVLTASPQNGGYTVQSTSAAGCASALSPPVTVTITGLAANLPGSSLLIFPNPTADGQPTLEMTGYEQAVTVTVLDAIGRSVYEVVLSGANGQRIRHVLPLTALSRGLYSVRVASPTGTVIRRLVHE